MSRLSAFLGLFSSAVEPKNERKSTTTETLGADKSNFELDQANNDQAQEIIDHILTAHSRLVGLADLSPGPITNEVLSGLVSLCIQVHEEGTTKQVLTNAQIRAVLPSLRRICAQAEFCLESHWAKHIVEGNDSEDALERLKSFPYYQNYEELTRLELCALCSVQPRLPTKVAFLGSGPLPLTSMCLLKAMKHGFLDTNTHPTGSLALETVPHGDYSVLNIDRDSGAINISTALNEKLGAWGQGMEFFCADADSAVQDLHGFDVVFLAALVGFSQADKEDLMVNIAGRMREGALMVVRTSWGLRTCLYPEVDMTSARLLQRLEVCVVVHPYGRVVNSVIVARVKSQS